MDRSSENSLLGVDAELARRVRNMAAALSARGIEIKVTSGKRSAERQAALWANRANNPYPVARPGTSKHEQGLAVDLVPTGIRTSNASSIMGEEGERAGLQWGGRFTKPDPVHFEMPDSGALVLNGSKIIAQAKEQASGVRVLAALGVTALLIHLLKD
jgi:hypothetical protein